MLPEDPEPEPANDDPTKRDVTMPGMAQRLVAAEQAAAEWLQLLGQDAFHVEAYKALRQIYLAAGDRERTFAVCAALVALRHADADEMAFYTQLRSPRLPRARGCLTDDAWVGCLYRSDQSRFISSVFGVIGAAVGLMRAAEHRQFGIKRSERRDLLADETLFSKVFTYAGNVLNVPLPEAYFRPEDPSTLQLANAREKQTLLPSVVAGGRMLGDKSEKDLAFRSAVFLAKLRPEHYLRLIVPTQTEMQVLLLSALSLVWPQVPVPQGERETVEKYRRVLRTGLPAAVLEQLLLVVQHYQQQPGPLDLGKWVQAVDLTANRAGLIVAGDLEVAIQQVSREPVTVDGVPTQDKVKDLLRYSVSPRYFAARHFLGLSLT